MGELKCHLTTHIPAQSRAGSAEDIWRNSTVFGVTVHFPGMNLTNMGHSTVETLGSVYEAYMIFHFFVFRILIVF